MTTSSVIIFVFALAASVAGKAQRANWVWAEQGISSGNTSTNRVTLDPFGSSISATSFVQPYQLGDSVFEASGDQDIVITSRDPDGVPKWSIHLGETGKTECAAIATDPITGDIYIAGTFQRRIRIGNQLLQPTWPDFGFIEDIFLTRIKMDGTVVWAQAFGTGYFDVISSVAVDSKHRIIIAGSFIENGASPVLIDSISFGTIKLVSNGNEDVYVAACDSTGQFLWARNFGSGRSEGCQSLSLDKKDNIIITGTINGQLTLDTVTLRPFNQGRFAGSSFVAKLDTSGKTLWAKLVGGIGPGSSTSAEYLYPSRCAVDSAGNPYVGGNYTGGSLIFDPVDRSTMISGGGQWIAKYNGVNGKVLWTKGIGYGFTHGFCNDDAGSLYLSGSGSTGAVYGPDTLRGPMSTNQANLIVIKYNEMGQHQWMQFAGDAAGASGACVSVRRPEEVVVAGGFAGGISIAFGTTTLTDYSTKSNGFVAKLKPPRLKVPASSTTSVVLAPNPSSGSFTISGAGTNGFDHYRVFDNGGQLVASGVLDSQVQQVTLPQIAPGIYQVQLSSSTQLAQQSITIIK